MKAHESEFPMSRTSLTTAATAALIALALGLSACASSQGFHRESLRDPTQGPPNQPSIENEAIAKALAKRPQLPKPFRVAVHFKSPPRHSDLRWKDSDRELFRRLANNLAPSDEISAIFPLAKALVRGEELEDLRLAAADQGADALLVVSANAEVERAANALSWTYLALVTALFVPGTTSEALVLSQASLWDVRNGFLYMSAEAEHLEAETAPLALLDDKELVEKTKRLSLEKLSAEVETQMQGLVGHQKAAKSM